jgi:hypothetical protein
MAAIPGDNGVEIGTFPSRRKPRTDSAESPKAFCGKRAVAATLGDDNGLLSFIFASRRRSGAGREKASVVRP